MRRTITLLLFVIAFISAGQAQWLLYDCSKLPSETGGDELDLTNLSQDAPGANFVEEIVADPEIDGNFLLRYVQPDEMNIAQDENATKMYRSYLRDGDGNDWKGSSMTIVARLKGVPNWQELGLDRVFDLQYRIGNNDMRDELRIKYENMLELEKSDASTGVSTKLEKWHVYRIAVDGKTSTVYMDESDDPVLEGESTSSTGDLYIKIGDGSGDKIGGMVDWVAIDTTGAYSPSEKPLDDRFTGADFDATQFSIAFVTASVDSNGVLDEMPLIRDLRNRGFTVDYTYPDPNDVTVPVDVEFSFDAMNDYDMVIIGRAVSSSDFQDSATVAGWASVTSPVVVFSGYLVRNSRLQLVNTGSVTRETGDGSTVDPMRITDITIENGPIFNGIPDTDGKLGYQTWFYEYAAYGADTFEMNHNGTLHGALSVPGGVGDGSVYVASWPAGVRAYDDADNMLAGPRMYFHTGSDDQSSPKLKNFFPFTEESTLLFHNSIKWLLGYQPDGELIPVLGQDVRGKIAFITKDVDPGGNLEEIELISELRKRGYQVDVSYPDPGDITVPPDFEFSYEALNDYDVTIIGRGVSSGDFQDPTAVEGWAGVESPVIIFSAYLMRNSRLNLANTGSASREAADGNTVARDRVTNTEIVDHPVFTGVDMDMDGEIGYLTWFYDFLGMGADTFEMTHNATLLATLASDGGPGDGTVYMALWEAGGETYPGSGTTQSGVRMYMQMGSDDSSSPKLRNYTAFTNESLIVLFNSLDWLSGRTPTGMLPEAGPIAHWNFDEGTGTDVKDAIGGANGEILSGNGMTWESCGVENSLNFAGSTKAEAIVQVEDHPNVNFDSTQSFSISLLVKADPFSNMAEMNLVLKGDNSTALPAGMGRWYAVATKDSELRFALDDNVTKTQLGVAINETMFPPAEWNHVVAVRDVQQDSLRLYLNGEHVGSLKDDTDLDISTDDLPLVMGNYHQSGRKLNGSIDEVAIYDFALSAMEVSNLYDGLETSTDCGVLETITETSNDASLKSLSVDPGSLDPSFDPDVLVYKVVLPEGSTKVTITAEANDAGATVEGDGEFTDVPGTAVVKVTAADSTIREYTLNISVEGVGPKRIVVEPGFGTIETAIAEANDGDTLVLKNGEFYNGLEAYVITKKLVMIAEEVPSLPGLDNQPIVENLFTVNPMFDLQSGADLHLIGLDIDAEGVANIFDVRGATGESRTISLYVNRCRLHETTEDILNEARDGNTDNTMLKSCVVRNSFIYDTGVGHGLYVKNFEGSNSDYIFENITYWDMGQQFNWIRHFTDANEQTFIYDHMTGYNLSTSTGDDKELFGNSDGAGEAVLNIQLKNSIFHTQVSANEGSLKFNNTSERHSISINNNVLYEVQPIFNLGGTIQEANNQVGTDPQFADPDQGDFTVMNSALYAAADDGEIIGATYWHPDFVDDFSDLVTSAVDLLKEKINYKIYPNPFDTEVTVEFKLENPAHVILTIYDMNGNLVEEVTDEKLIQGYHNFMINTSDYTPGVYFSNLYSNGNLVARKMIKAK